MFEAAFGIFVISTIGFMTLSIYFVEALKSDAPEIYEAMGKPSVGRYLWRRQLLMPFSDMVLFRTYRNELAEFPRARAWASWLFVVHWLQIGAFVVLIADMALG
jgi:hypothetical protein